MGKRWSARLPRTFKAVRGVGNFFGNAFTRGRSVVRGVARRGISMAKHGWSATKRNTIKGRKYLLGWKL